jgi:His/Glu/Gln/Arg/opine family amino acid ABC transporter permease subunit
VAGNPRVQGHVMLAQRPTASLSLGAAWVLARSILWAGLVFIGGTALLLLLVRQFVLQAGLATSGGRGWTPHFEVVLQNLPYLLEGLLSTLQLAGTVGVLAFVLGIVVALARLSRIPLVFAMATGYVEVLRNTPALVQLFLIYFGPPTVGIRLSVTVAAVLGLTINNSAYMAEIIRAGIRSISRGQTEAATAVGMTYPQVMRYVILPQALRVVFPPLVNQWISIVLFSSLASVIAYPELTEHAKRLDSRTFRSFEIYGAVTVIYTICTLLLALLLRLIERRMFPVMR